MTDTKKKETETFDPKLLKKASDMSEKQLAEFVKAARAERKKRKDEKKKDFSIAAGKIVLKFIKDIEGDKFPEDFKKEILTIYDKFLKE
jgi:transposase-like protein